MYSKPKGHKREIPALKLIKKGSRKKPQNRRMTISMLGRKSLPNKEKVDKNNEQKTYNWCNWHKEWVEHDLEGK